MSPERTIPMALYIVKFNRQMYNILSVSIQYSSTIIIATIFLYRIYWRQLDGIFTLYWSCTSVECYKASLIAYQNRHFLSVKIIWYNINLLAGIMLSCWLATHIEVVCRLAGMQAICVCRSSVDFLRLCSTKQRGPNTDGRTKRTWTMEGECELVVSTFNFLCKALEKSRCRDLSIRRHPIQPTVYDTGSIALWQANHQMPLSQSSIRYISQSSVAVQNIKNKKRICPKKTEYIKYVSFLERRCVFWR